MIYPSNFPEDINNTAEEEVYNALKKLPQDDFDVYYQKTFSGFVKGESDDYEIDFLVVDKRNDRFNALLVIEVKGGSLSYSAKENAWYQNSRKLKAGPDAQARKNKHNLLKRYRSLLNNVPVEWALWFPEGVNKSGDFVPTNLAAWQIMDNMSLAYCEDAIVDVFDQIRSKHPQSTGEPIESYNRKLSKSLLRGLGIVQPLNILLKNYEKEFVYLEEMQKMFFEHIYQSQRVAVTGGAGTGKTLLASSAAVDLANEGNKVLLLCFNRMLYLALEATCAHENLDISTYHTLAYNYIYDVEPDWYSKQDTKMPEFYEYVFPLKLHETIQSQNLENQYDVLIIDEAQDFNEFWIRTAFSLVKNNGKIILLFDENQNIFQRYFNIPEEESFTKTRLKYNFRNTEKIGEYTSKRTGFEIQTMKTPKGLDVDEISYDTFDDLIYKLQQELTRLIDIEKLSCNDITILIDGRVKEHPFYFTENIGKWQLEAWEVNEERDPGKIYFTSISRFKGLESQVVLLVPESNGDFKGDKRFYTQSTRAKSLLKVFLKNNQTQ
jgi:hypothetical protein